MIKKGLFKKVTALTLALCLAASPTFVYAADDVVEVFAEEGESVSDDVGYSSSDDAEEVFQEEKEVNEEINEEETVYDEPEFVGEDIVEENNEPVFTEDSVVTEDSATEDVAAAEEAFGVDDTTMEQLVAGAENDVVDDVVTEETVTDDSSLASSAVAITFKNGGGTGDDVSQTITKGTATPLKRNTFTNGTYGFVNWKDQNGTTYTDCQSVNFSTSSTTDALTLTAQWGTSAGAASIGTVYYDKLATAFTASEALETIKLEKTELTESVTVNKATVLDLNNFTFNGSFTISSGELFIRDSHEDGKGISTGFVKTIPSSATASNLVISAGTYSTDVSKYCDDGYVVTKTTREISGKSTTVYQVIKKDEAVAKVGDYYYVALASAFEAVSSTGGTLTLLKDPPTFTSATPITIEKDIVINSDVTGGSTLTLGAATYILFKGKCTIDKSVTVNTLRGAFVGAATLNGSIEGAGEIYAVGSTVDLAGATAVNNTNILYGSTVSATGSLESGDALGTPSPTVTLGSIALGNRGSNTLSLTNVSVSATQIASTNDAEVSGLYKNNLRDKYGYTPSSIPTSNGTGKVSLSNSRLNLTGNLDLGTLGTREIALSNGSYLYDAGTITVNKGNTISMDYKSYITAKSLVNNGTLEVDLSGLTLTGFDSLTKKELVSTESALTADDLKNVKLINNAGFGVALESENKKIVLKKADVTVTHGSTTTSYTTIEEALKAALDGDTITILKDASLAANFTVTGKKKLTLDTNGYNLTVPDAYQIVVDAGSELTLKDAYSGTIKDSTSATETIKVNGTLNMQSGYIDGDSTTISLANKNAKVTISGGTVAGQIAAPMGTLEVSKGTIDNVVIGVSGTKPTDLAKATFTGGTITTGKNITVNEHYDTVSVTSTLTGIISKVTPPSTAYVWVTSGGMSNLVTLEDALNKSAAGSVVKLSADVTLASGNKLDVSQEVTLDMNGCDITASGSLPTYAIGVKNGAKLTIINSQSTKGNITATDRDTAILMNPDNNRNPSTTAELIVGSASDSGSNRLNISGKNYGISGTAKYTNTAETVNGGTITGGKTAINNPQDKSTVTINGGNIYAPTNAIYISSGSTLKIKGGTVGNATTGTSVYIKQVSGGSAINVDITGGTINAKNYSIYEENGNSVNNVTICVAGGNIGDDIHADNARGFLEGGRYQSDPTKNNSHKDYVVAGATVTELTGTYKYQLKSDIKRYTVTTTYTSGGSATAPTVTPSGAQKASTSITVTAGPAADGYKFDGWYENDKQVSTASSYKFNITANRTLEARYLKGLTVTAPTETVPLGQDYKGNTSLIKVTGLNSSDTESTMIDKSAAVITAASYKKDTAKVGDTFDTSVTGVKLTTAGAKKYYIATYDKGKLTVIKSATAEEFVKAVEKLPTADKATAENRMAVDAAKTMYEGLSAAEKNQADVKAAKTKLDAVDTAVTNHEKADAADALIKALPDAKDATSADREALDAANEAYKALTDEQKKMVPDADREKLAQVEAAVKAAEKADQEAAAAVKNLIDALPSVTEATAADRDALTEAQEAYDALTPEQKKLLPGAEATLEALDEVITAAEKDQKAADAVTKMINALPDPEDATAADRGVVDEAKAALDKLTPAQKKLVPQTAKDRLEAVDEAVKSKEGGDDQKAADACMEKIEAIKKQPAGKGKAATEEARAAYDALTDAQKALLPKSAEELLVAAEEAYTKDRTFQCGDAMYKVLPSGNVSYNRPSDTKCTSAVVPNQIKKNGYMYKVVKVSIGAFKNCENLNWVVINKNIAAIGKYAFKNTPSLTKINIKSRTLKTGKVVSAFAAGGKSNGAKLLVKTPSAYVSSYTSLFKGEGLLNQKAKVQAA